MSPRTSGRRTALSAILAIVLSGCIGLSRTEEQRVAELQALGVRADEQQEKGPAVAGALNLLPGAGNFYLAHDTSARSQLAIGFANLWFWPLSIFWGIPQAAIDAGSLNEKATVDYYYGTDEGLEQLELLRQTRGAEAPASEG